MKIVVLYGGESPEREVSIQSGRSVACALRKKGHKVFLLDPSKKSFLKKILEIKPGCAFIALHGGMGESGIIQGFLEVLNIPYTGSGVRSSAICMNKILTKKILMHHKLPTPAFVEIQRGVKISLPFSFPAVVKPANLGSTIGIKIVKNSRQLESAVKECFSIDNEVFVEEYVRGVEITAGLLGDNDNPELLPLIEIETKTGFYDYNAKYSSGGSRHIIPPRLNEKTIKEIESVSLNTYKVLGCSGLARMEMIVKSGIPYILDVNTIPGLTNLSLLPDAARAKGISFEDLCEKILMFAEKNAKKKNK